ncbi:phosphoribosyltransferase [Sphingomonas nostoxanthinifaciens]|uniref:phosphoribosyltransferase n=1 Tax=Sphingomonas nostoxanthinifaciens TaxID=2872652 RepID=UPI001CC218F7|nr:phosphoribosyltransferase family protein [Sphingomonas nostoxanthinifaciens]UAK26372.1 phosphoribosyltransferase [Sphingomonas nostoxanthinifaciens]
MTDPQLAPIPYEEFVAGVHALADALAAETWRPDYIVGIGRGGLVPGAYLSHRTGIPLLSVDYSSGVPGFAAELMAKLAAETRAGRRILLIDDINDSGSTIVALRAGLAEAGGPADHVRVAVLIDNVRSRAKADYRARTIDRAVDKSWFIFPWEQMADRSTVIEDAGAMPERLA